MPRLKRARRVLIIVAVLLVMAVVGVGVLGVSTVRQSFPQTGGELAIEGLTTSVSVLRDDRGIPTIYADTASDLFRAQGFVSAQDRFFEMDLRRHLTAGRLAEMVGASGLESDRAVRTMGWRRVAEQELPRLAPETRQYLQAYADGVNAYIGQVGVARRRCRSNTRSSSAATRATASSPGPPSTPSPGSRRWPGTCAATTTTS